MNTSTLCVVYRTGGTENFKWRRTLAMTPEEASKAWRAIETMGYPASIQGLTVPLPTTFNLPEWF